MSLPLGESPRSDNIGRIVRVAAVSGALLVGGYIANEELHPFGDPDSSNSAQAERLAKYPKTFEDPEAEAVAVELGITPADYYKVPDELVDKMTGGHFLDDGLAANFPPAIQKHKKVLEKAASNADIPVNTLATLATIESAGRADAQSGAGAHGLLQVVPSFHIDGYIARGYLPPTANKADYLNAMNRQKSGQKSVVSKRQYEAAINDPAISAQVGADFYAKCIAAARKKNSIDPNSPQIFAIAGAAYNGGIGLTSMSFDNPNFHEESKLYINHVIRILIDVEVAKRLENKDMSNDEINAAMWSNEMNARAYAYDMYGQLHPNETFGEYNQRASYLTTPVPGSHHDHLHARQARQMKAWYQAYRDGRAQIESPNHRYLIPAAPGLRIWLAGGGISLFANMSENANWRLK